MPVGHLLEIFLEVGAGWSANKDLETMACRIFSVGKSGALMDFQGKECYIELWPNALKQ
jgi:hypothetical protein